MAARKPRTAAKKTTDPVDVTGRPIWPDGTTLKPLPAAAASPPDEKTEDD